MKYAMTFNTSFRAALASLILWSCSTVLFAAPCVDMYEVMFSARPAGTLLWISPQKPFLVTLPGHLEATGGTMNMSLRLKRRDDTVILAEFEMQTESDRNAALYALQVDKRDPDTLVREVMDENGNRWSIQLYPRCPKYV